MHFNLVLILDPPNRLLKLSSFLDAIIISHLKIFLKIHLLSTLDHMEIKVLNMLMLFFQLQLIHKDQEPMVKVILFSKY